MLPKATSHDTSPFRYGDGILGRGYDGDYAVSAYRQTPARRGIEPGAFWLAGALTKHPPPPLPPPVQRIRFYSWALFRRRREPERLPRQPDISNAAHLSRRHAGLLAAVPHSADRRRGAAADRRRFAMRLKVSAQC
ncbi:hypothetical protein NHX12_022653 [Muraenolepis orangiensis]|uniref:Uncharacterized protein n=1 Tax=Muraenolepis orangiensis TaxID=630683 RepID=A0A9Q0ERE9_9TELE|nr:hypothetical protein NHX12_022653 [Muraenolepis orangiensis]